jgi:predicted pyridoxine 5'-phosphate oxidase superfamily flavin-nucleotide-binding protein
MDVPPATDVRAAALILLGPVVLAGSLAWRHRRPAAPPAASAAWPGGRGEHELQRRHGSQDRAGRFYRQQLLDRLNRRMIEFIGRQEMVWIATADGAGECDCSFRAGPPGFVQVLDARTMRYPEYRGNGVMASLGNILENPHVGMVFLDFDQERIGLHVNGTARIVEADGDRNGGRLRVERWVEVHVQEAYIHCRKHLPHLVKVAGSDRRAWGTDDARAKGGDYFGASCEPRPWAAAPAPELSPSARPVGGAEPPAIPQVP